MTDPCTHDLAERETVCADGYCPLCMIKDLSALRQELVEFEQTFDLRWKADQRAIKMWQAAGKGRELTWPDHADLVVWLLERREDDQARFTDAMKTMEEELDRRQEKLDRLKTAFRVNMIRGCSPGASHEEIDRVIAAALCGP